jgi:hypothetical protein
MLIVGFVGLGAQDIDEIVSKEWVGRVRWMDNNTYWEYTLRFDLQEDVFADVRAEILWEFTDTNSREDRRLNNISVWTMEGDYLERSRTLVLEDLSREDPNDFISIWWEEMHLVFNADGTEFIATIFKGNGNPVRDNAGNTIEILGRAR